MRAFLSLLLMGLVWFLLYLSSMRGKNITPRKNGLAPGPCGKESAFSLVEVLVALGFIGLTVGGIYGGLLKVNEYADTNRLNSCATAIVQAQLDRAFSVRPFYPLPQPTIAGDPFDNVRNTPTVSGTTGVPAALMITGTLGVPKITPVNIFMNSDALASGSNAAAAAVVTGTLTTLVNDANIFTGGTTAISGTAMLRSINVKLTYRYHGRPCLIQMTGLRAPDQ